MTLVVARIAGQQIAVVSDTLVSEHGQALPLQQGMLKSCFLPGGICVSFCNSPELAHRDFRRFMQEYPQGAGFSEVIAFFERSSRETGNDYIIAFSQFPRIVRITEGRRSTGSAKTLWIGDKEAYERFREYESKTRPNVQTGRAIPAVLFADDMTGAPGSDLYSSMRHVLEDRGVPSVGGFAYVISNRQGGFRQSAYCDMLYNWPEASGDEFVLALNDPIDFGVSGENLGYSISQFSSGYLNFNLTAFYMLAAKTLFLFFGADNGPATNCNVLRGVDPEDIAAALNRALGGDFNWLGWVAAAVGSAESTIRAEPRPSGNQGTAFGFKMLFNSFPKSAS